MYLYLCNIKLNISAYHNCSITVTSWFLHNNSLEHIYSRVSFLKIYVPPVCYTSVWQCIHYIYCWQCLFPTLTLWCWLHFHSWSIMCSFHSFSYTNCINMWIIFNSQHRKQEPNLTVIIQHSSGFSSKGIVLSCGSHQQLMINMLKY